MKRNELKGRIGNFLSTAYKLPYRPHDDSPYRVRIIFERPKIRVWMDFFGVQE